MMLAAFLALGLAGLAAAQAPLASTNVSRVNISVFSGAACTGNAPSVISIGMAICQADSPTGSYVANCNSNGGGVILFCADSTCSKSCSERPFANGVCTPATKTQANSGASFLATCVPPAAAPAPSASPRPLVAAPAPSPAGPVPSTIPSSTVPVNGTLPDAPSSSGAASAAGVAAAAAAAVVAIAAAMV